MPKKKRRKTMIKLKSMFKKRKMMQKMRTVKPNLRRRSTFRLLMKNLKKFKVLPRGPLENWNQLRIKL